MTLGIDRGIKQLLYINSHLADRKELKLGSHERHKHKQRKQSMTSPLGLAKTE